MRSGRRIDTHIGPAIAFDLRKRAVDVFAHAVQPLKFERFRPCEGFHRADGVGVVGGESRVDDVVRRQQFVRAGEIADIGRKLAGEHREIREAANMAQLDLGIPIGTFDQPDEEAPVVFARQPRNPFAHWHAAFLVRLDGEAEPFVARTVGAREQVVIARQGLDDVHRQFEPVGLFGVDGEVDIGIARLGNQRPEHRQQTGDGKIGMEEGVLGMQRRKLHRDAGGRGQIAGRFAGQSIDRGFVAGAIAFGIIIGHRPFAQHVEAVREALCPLRRGALEGFADGAAINELAAKNAHGLQGRLADHRLAEPRDSALQ